MSIQGLTKKELLQELTLDNEELLLVYGTVSQSAREICDSMSELLASTLAVERITAAEIYRLHLGVCGDEKYKMYVLFTAVIIGLITKEHFDDLNTGRLVVVDFDDLIIRYRKRINDASEFFQILLGN